MTRKKASKGAVLLELFQLICQQSQYWDKWRPDQHWVDIIIATYPDMKGIGFTKSDLNKAIGRHPQLKHCQMIYGSDSNNYGIHFQNHRVNGVRTFVYLATKPGTKVKKPPTDKLWWEGICSIFKFTLNSSRNESLIKLVCLKEVAQYSYSKWLPI